MIHDRLLFKFSFCFLYYTIIISHIFTKINHFSPIFFDYSIGYTLALEVPEEEAAFYIIISAVIALICIIPYLLCFIFSKKYRGWMIGALVLFGIDSAIFMIDFVSLISMGDVSMIFDLVIRIFALYELIDGVRAAAKLKAEEENPTAIAASNAYFPQEEGFASGMTRTVTLTRKKNFSACAVPFLVFVNGKEVCTLKNGEAKSFEAPVEAFELGIALSSAGISAGKETVPAGNAPTAYTAEAKLGMTAARIAITKN